MLEVIQKVLVQKYASIQGRANRTEYWIWVLFTAVLGIIIGIFHAVSDVLYYVLMGIVNVALIVPGVCVTVRRLHDTGRGGGWACLAFIPVIGTIWLLVLMLLPGEPQANRFGEVPTTTI